MQEPYYTINGWGWVFIIYFFGTLISFMVSIFTIDDFTFSKKKKFSWGAFFLILLFAAFSWFGLIAMIKFDNKHNNTNRW